MIRSTLVFLLLFVIRLISRIFYRYDIRWIGGQPEDRWGDIRILAVLNHTSLYEPLLVGAAGIPLMWGVARNGVLPVAEKTMKRPRVGLLFRFIARKVVVVTRRADHTWDEMLRQVDDQSLVIILPEGRMKRRNGLDSNGRTMTVRGGIADIIRATPSGRILVVYSGGLHHIQAPGELLPRPFKTIRMGLEHVDIESYRARLLEEAGEKGFKRAVIDDLSKRRDAQCGSSDEISD